MKTTLRRGSYVISIACWCLCLIGLSASQVATAAAPLRQHTVAIDGHDVAVWSRIPSRPQRTILLVHGRTWSALPDFDLHIPQRRDIHRSVMEALADRGYAVYAIDLRGYGSTKRNADGWNTPLQASNDIAVALQWIASRHPKLSKPTLLGWSMGSVLSHLTAQLHGELISNLILLGYPRDPARTQGVPPTPSEPPREINTRERAASDFISPDMISSEVLEAYIAASLKADPVRADWKQTEEYNVLDPAKIHTPTLLIHGEIDPLAPIAAQGRVFVALGTGDKQWVVLPKGAHAALLEDTHDAFIAAIRAFIERPPIRGTSKRR